MPASERQQKGAELRRQLMGEGYVDRINQTLYNDPHMQKFRELTTETIFGTLWTRPGLDLKTRTLICVVSDTVMGRAPELALQVRMAMRQGWTEDELVEVLLHLLGYAGAPLVREALLTAKEVFAEVRAGK
jgi:4-carboxymuconolactone decarboxylase